MKIVAVEPAASPLLSKGVSGAHPLQGLGANFIPDTLDTSIYDEIITVEGKDAYEAVRSLGKREGDIGRNIFGSGVARSIAVGAKTGKRRKKYSSDSARYGRKVSFYRAI